MLSFSIPSALIGDNLQDELRLAGFLDATVAIAGDALCIYGVTEGDRAGVQAVIADHTGELTAEQQAPLTVQTKIETAKNQMKTELENWPAPLVQGSTLNQVGARVNLLMEQEERNTERLYWLAQKLLGQFD